MSSSVHKTKGIEPVFLSRLRFLLGVLLSTFIFVSAAFSIPQISSTTEANTLEIESSPDMEIISFSKKVVVKKEAKGVLVFGSDVVVEGRVTGDVAAIGGSVIQREGAFIGGDVIVVGGRYVTESLDPLRETNKQTIIFAAYEEELRELAQDPLQLFSPAFTVSFVALRLVLLLFWFLLSLGFTTIAPGAVGRAVARLNISATKVFALGFFTFLATNILLFAALNSLPNYAIAVVVGMSFLTLLLVYVFGRVALHVAFGKLIHKYLVRSSNRSESLSLLLGVAAWTVLLSLPYVWTLAVIALFSAGTGLVLTARSSASWKGR